MYNVHSAASPQRPRQIIQFNEFSIPFNPTHPVRLILADLTMKVKFLQIEATHSDSYFHKESLSGLACQHHQQEELLTN